MEFSRQEYCSGLPCPPPEDLLTQGLNLNVSHLLYLLHLQACSLPLGARQLSLCHGGLWVRWRRPAGRSARERQQDELDAPQSCVERGAAALWRGGSVGVWPPGVLPREYKEHPSSEATARSPLRAVLPAGESRRARGNCSQTQAPGSVSPCDVCFSHRCEGSRR